MKNPILGFEVSMSMDECSGSEWGSEYFDRFLTDAIEGHGLNFGGSPEGGFVVAVNGKTTNVHRVAVHEWLLANGVEYVEIGELVDSNA